MRVGDLLEMGVCTPACLLALVPEGSCKCRCDGEHHGIAADLEVEVSEEADPRSTYSLLLPRAKAMMPQDQMRFLELNGWRPDFTGWIDPQDADGPRLGPVQAIILTWQRAGEAQREREREKAREYRRRKKETAS